MIFAYNQVWCKSRLMRAKRPDGSLKFPDVADASVRFRSLSEGDLIIGPKTTASSLDKSRGRTYVGVLDRDVMYLVVRLASGLR